MSPAPTVGASRPASIATLSGEQLGSRGMTSMSTAQTSAPTGFERAATSAWRTVRGILPQSVAEAIRRPAKRALRAVGLVRSS
jgi:hypothetical protein